MWQVTFGTAPYKDWDGKVLCVESNAEKTMKSNITQGFLAGYAFTLVTRGWLTMRYNDREMKIEKDDLYIYSPGLIVTITACSPDYESICLMVDEFTTLESPAVRDMVSLAFLPIVQLSSPILSLTPDQASMFEGRMQEMIGYLRSSNIYKDKLLRMLYAVFLMDLQNAQEQVITHHQIPPRVEEIFIEFNRLLPQHFLNHRDVGFYADRLCISSDYLSRIVKQVSNRTVGDFINQMLLMESTYLLRTSSLSIAQISDRLHFSEPAAFTRFFKRMKGISPREFKKGRGWRLSF